MPVSPALVPIRPRLSTSIGFRMGRFDRLATRRDRECFLAASEPGWPAHPSSRTGTAIKEASVKRICAPTILASVFGIVLALGTVSRAQAGERGGCSKATLRGSFGFTSTGTLLALPPPFAGPFAEVGRQTFDGKGNTDATATASANGNIAQLTLQGTYVVNPDCTGSMTLFVFE
jgi:hypothetical protein